MAGPDHGSAMFIACTPETFTDFFRSLDFQINKGGSGFDCSHQLGFGLFPSPGSVSGYPAGSDKRCVGEGEQFFDSLNVQRTSVQADFGHLDRRDAVF